MTSPPPAHAALARSQRLTQEALDLLWRLPPWRFHPPDPLVDLVIAHFTRRNEAARALFAQMAADGLMRWHGLDPQEPYVLDHGTWRPWLGPREEER